MTTKNLHLFKNINLNSSYAEPDYKIWTDPPYCPNRACLYHHQAPKNNFIKKGVLQTKKYPHFNQRYQCKSCHKVFTANYFSQDYRKKFIAFGPIIVDAIANGETIRSVAKKIDFCESSVRKRIKGLAKQAQIFENIKAQNLKIDEDIVYDGFESFSYSQFDPCYVNTAVGAESYYTYATTFSPLNRKGRMTKWQKTKLKILEGKHGKYPTNSVQKESGYIIKKLSTKCSTQQLVLITDEHKSYECALSKMDSRHIKHIQINSKQRRNPSNSLFAVNHLHLTMRHFNSSHRRQTISFNKNEAALMDAVHIIRIHKNFMRSKFEKNNFLDKNASTQSPAMKVGIAEKIYTFDEIFNLRRPPSHASFDGHEWEVYNRKFNYARRKIV